MGITPPCGEPLVFHYGESTGLFIGENELRIGHEPQGYCLVLSKGKGEFPIRYMLAGKVTDTEEPFYTQDYSEILAMAQRYVQST